MRIWPAVIVALLAVADPARACSTRDGYRVPSNFELVQKAKVIALARVIDAPRDSEAAMNGKEGQFVKLQPIRFLKGTLPASDLRLLGWQPPANWTGVPTVTTLRESHFSAGLGACVRQFYQPGEIVVAMFDQDTVKGELLGSSWNQLFEPFARAVETVEGETDVWVRAVEQYIALQRGNAATLKDRMRVAIAELHRTRTNGSEAIARDLELQLDGRTPKVYWSSFASPMTAAAGISGYEDARLICIAGTPPSIMLKSAASVAELRVAGVAYKTSPSRPNGVETTLLRGDKSLSFHRFSNSGALLKALQTEAGDVELRGGSKPLKATPAEALLFWARHCEKLQAVPTPKE